MIEELKIGNTLLKVWDVIYNNGKFFRRTIIKFVEDGSKNYGYAVLYKNSIEWSWLWRDQEGFWSCSPEHLIRWSK